MQRDERFKSLVIGMGRGRIAGWLERLKRRTRSGFFRFGSRDGGGGGGDGSLGFD